MNNEPVAWMLTDRVVSSVPMEGAIPLYTHPVKELTDEEIVAVWDNDCVVLDEDKLVIRFARAILRKAQEADKIESLGTVNIGGVHYRNGKEVK